jgi:hypothetical protein
MYLDRIPDGSPAMLDYSEHARMGPIQQGARFRDLRHHDVGYSLAPL